jgi:hypothetical protein
VRVHEELAAGGARLLSYPALTAWLIARAAGFDRLTKLALITHSSLVAAPAYLLQFPAFAFRHVHPKNDASDDQYHADDEHDHE